MKNTLKKLLIMLALVLLTANSTVSYACAANKAERNCIVTENITFLQESTGYIVDENGNFSTVKEVKFTVPKSTVYTITVGTSGNALVYFRKGDKNIFSVDLNKSTHQKRYNLVKGTEYTIQFTNEDAENNFFVALVHQTYD